MKNAKCGGEDTVKQEALWKLILKATYREMGLNFGTLRESMCIYKGKKWETNPVLQLSQVDSPGQ